MHGDALPRARCDAEAADGRGLAATTVASRSGACGPCTARTARSCGRVVAADGGRRTRSVFDAFGITSNTSPSVDGCHHTMMSSSTDAVGVVEQVGVLRPAGRDLAEVVGQRALQLVEGVGAVDAHGAEVDDVEHHGVRRGRPGARRACRVGYSSGMSQPPNGTMLGAEGAVDGVERRALGRVRPSPRTVTGAVAGAAAAASSARAGSSWRVDLVLHAGERQHVEHALARCGRRR